MLPPLFEKLQNQAITHHTPEAIRQGLAIFDTEWSKGRLRNKTAHRYLVKMIQNCHDKISAVCRHIRRLFEAAWNDRFVLISKLVAW